MREELQDKLFEKYPEIFQQRHLTIQESCMPWGICCGDGWYNIIDVLCRCITNHVMNVNSSLEYKKSKGESLEVEPMRTPQASQVKEKFGGLRFYVDYADEYTYALIHMAETMSYVTCYTCGSPGNTTNSKGWMMRLCQPCKDEHDKRGTS